MNFPFSVNDYTKFEQAVDNFTTRHTTITSEIDDSQKVSDSLKDYLEK